MLNNRNYNIDQNNRDYDFCHNRAGLYTLICINLNNSHLSCIIFHDTTIFTIF